MNSILLEIIVCELFLIGFMVFLFIIKIIELLIRISAKLGSDIKLLDKVDNLG